MNDDDKKEANKPQGFGARYHHKKGRLLGGRSRPLRHRPDRVAEAPRDIEWYPDKGAPTGGWWIFSDTGEVIDCDHKPPHRESAQPSDEVGKAAADQDAADLDAADQEAALEAEYAFVAHRDEADDDESGWPGPATDPVGFPEPPHRYAEQRLTEVAYAAMLGTVPTRDQEKKAKETDAARKKKIPKGKLGFPAELLAGMTNPCVFFNADFRRLQSALDYNFDVVFSDFVKGMLKAIRDYSFAFFIAEVQKDCFRVEFFHDPQKSFGPHHGRAPGVATLAEYTVLAHVAEQIARKKEVDVRWDADKPDWFFYHSEASKMTPKKADDLREQLINDLERVFPDVRFPLGWLGRHYGPPHYGPCALCQGEGPCKLCGRPGVCRCCQGTGRGSLTSVGYNRQGVREEVVSTFPCPDWPDCTPDANPSGGPA